MRHKMSVWGVVVVNGSGWRCGFKFSLDEWTRELGDSKREKGPNYIGSRTRHRRSNSTKQSVPGVPAPEPGTRTDQTRGAGPNDQAPRRRAISLEC